MTNKLLFESWRLGLLVHYAFYDAHRAYAWGAPGVHPDGRLPASLDELADGCDTEGLAEMAAAMQAEYCIFTAWHANMNLLYPSAVMDAWRPGHAARRDVIADLAGALDRRGIQLLLYKAQLNGYAMIAESLGTGMVQRLALVYYEPVTDITVEDVEAALFSDGFTMRFRANILPVKLDAALVPSLLVKAKAIHDLSEPPAGRDRCWDCGLLNGILAAMPIS